VRYVKVLHFIDTCVAQHVVCKHSVQYAVFQRLLLVKQLYSISTPTAVTVVHRKGKYKDDRLPLICM